MPVDPHRSSPHSAAPALAASAMAGVLVLAGACATSSGLVRLSHWSPPLGQKCEVVEPEGDIHALVDSAALADRIAGLDLRVGSLLLSVAVDSGDVHRFQRIEASLLLGDADQLEEVVEGAVADGPGGPARGRFLIRVWDSVATKLQLSAYQVCPPSINREWFVASVIERMDVRDIDEGTSKVWMLIDTTGHVLDVQMQRSGVPALDTAVVRVARVARFRPALVDRQPVRVWTVLDFDLERANVFLAPRYPRYYVYR